MPVKKKRKNNNTPSAIRTEVKKAISYEAVLWYAVIIACFIFRGAFFAGELLALTIILCICFFSFSQKISIDTNLILLGCILIFATVSFSLFSVDRYTSFIDLQKYVILFLSYFVFINVKNIHSVERAFYSGMVILMLCGIFGIMGAEMFSSLVTEKGQRLQSFLQYANTTALFMGVGILLSIDRFIKEKKLRYIVFGVLFATALYFTQSRITLILFICVFALYILISLKGKLRLLFGGLLLLFLLIIICVGGRIIRISFLEPTLIERIITYIDAFKAVICEPFFGIGLGNWQFLSFSFQSAPYQVKYIHSLYLQIALDIGIIAAAIFIFIIIYNIIKKHDFQSIYYYIFIFVILHSALEVNFNYGIFDMYFALLLVLITQKSCTNISFNFSKISVYIKNTVIVVCSIILIIPALSEAFITAGDISMRKGDIYNADSYYKKANSINPYNNTIPFKLAQTESDADNAISFLENTLSNNPYQFSAKSSLIEGYLFRGKYEKAIEASDSLMKSFPYNKAFQELSINVITQAYEKGFLDKSKYDYHLKEIHAFIDKKNSMINPLYKYIDSNMDY